MYIDLVLLVIIVLAVIFFFKRFSSFVYLVCSLDILYRLLHFLADNLKVEELKTLIHKYIPSSVSNMICNYTCKDNVFYIIVIWSMFVLYCILLFYIIRILVRRKF